ncbi:hypothetical protein A3K72_03965 [Candidatus Woesearchaeota archaeon RBG_13_36_6]|nr:MAG: hypothetical protein A3K72_03965 [Candidatus Woesearchaeota archaeon RBG_13_36_6]
MALDPKKKRLIMIGAVSLVIILLLVVLVKSPLFKGVRDTITGMVIGSETGEGEAEAEAEAEADVIKTIKVYTELYSEDFQVPIDNLDLTIEAKEIEIITPSADIIISLEEPMVFEAFTGTVNWRNSIFTLEGQLNKYLTNLVQINWKTAEDVKIRVKQGKVSISQINIASFGAVVSGDIKLADKATLSPVKDLVTLKNFRGSLTAVVEDMQTKLVMDGTIDNIYLGSQEFDLNIN